ncbi:helix-turn-helix domain-containing protein [Kaistella carnis]|uniref:AraC family transcriptional regulator n=1 Tax=Kaistella carnis TaxID=1241979 RepID=A0A3G8XL86_9FLAO|nr:helix-turn-helix domain-containing protein [Kaistella carnis]AZI34120.1 AraC family transcriptional regulator [Kaistella carnis]
MGRNIFLFCMLIGAVCTAQESVLQYMQLQKSYADFPENDARALPAVQKSIRLGKKNQNFRHLVYAYEDAAYYSKDRRQKLLYSDSIIQAAKKTGDTAMISKAYLAKGIVFYFNYRNYDQALDQYLEAAAFADETGEDYLIFKIKYNIGVVKSYLGFINPDLTIINLAAALQVTKNNLSYVINEHLNMNFTTYLNTLRIRYITEKLNSDREFLKLKTPELARKCGIKSRQHFSRLFYEHNKIRPSDFIELRIKQLKSIN